MTDTTIRCSLTDDDEEKDGENVSAQRNRRRESQNRASRNYRQRKKAYIKEIEAKLDQLKLENDQLRTENQKNRRMLSQVQTLLDKPAPLIRSYSTELKTEDEEIEKLVSQLNDVAQGNGSEDQLKILLRAFHSHVAKRHSILNKEAMQLINPKMQERLVRIEGVPPHQMDEQMEAWLSHVAQFVTPDQIGKLSSLRRTHVEERAKIWTERRDINADIKVFYQEKLAAERLNTPGLHDQSAILTLTNKLELLKKNLTREYELNNNTMDEFSSILTPYQEAIITIKHYNFYKDKLSATQMLNNVWSVLSKDV